MQSRILVPLLRLPGFLVWSIVHDFSLLRKANVWPDGRDAAACLIIGTSRQYMSNGKLHETNAFAALLIVLV